MTEIFDQAAALSDTKIHAFEIANDVRDMEAATNTAKPVEITAPAFDDHAFKAQMTNAFISHYENSLPKPEKDEPSTSEIFGAAFRTGNTVVSALSNQTMRSMFAPPQSPTPISDEDIIARVTKEGMQPLLQSFQGVTTEEEYADKLADVTRQVTDQRIMEASGLTGTAAMLIAGVVDIPTLIPVGKALQLGKAAIGTGEAALRTAGAGAIDAAISEAGLQATQDIRTKGEGAINIAGGAILGGMLGGAVHTFVGRDLGDKIERDFDAYRAEAAVGFPKNASAGAAMSDEAMAANAKAATGAYNNVPALGLDKIPSIYTAPTEYLAEKIGNTTLIGRPREVFRTSEIGAVREFGRRFYASPEVTEANVAGLPNSKAMTVEDHIGADRAQLGVFLNEVDRVYRRSEKGKYKSANDLAEQAYYAAITGGFDKIRGDHDLEAVARAFNAYGDFQHAKHVANNRLADDTAVMGAEGGYVRRVYNQAALRHDKDRAKEMLASWALKKVQKDFDTISDETGYGAQLDAFNTSKATYKDRVAQHSIDYEKALAEWEVHKARAEIEAATAFQRSTAAYRDDVADWGSNPANDGKPHPYGKAPSKSSFEPDLPAKPVKGAKPTKTDGYPKPARPRGMVKKENIELEAMTLARDVYHTIAGMNSHFATATTSRVDVKSGYLKGRVIDIPDEALAEGFFLHTNLIEHAELMHRTSGKQAAFGSVFKTTRLFTNEDGSVDHLAVGDYDGSSVLKQIEAETQPLVEGSLGKGVDEAIRDRTRILNGVKNEIDIALGTFSTGGTLIKPELAHMAAGISYFTKLGGVVLSSAMDPVKVTIAHGLGDTFKFGILPMLQSYRATIARSGPMREQGIRTGNVMEVLHSVRMAEAFELHNPFATGNRVTAFIQKGTKLATSLSMIAHWTDLNKQIAHNVTSSRLLKFAQVGPDRLTAKNKTWIANLGLSEDDMATVALEYGKQDTKHVAGVLYADLDRWADQDVAAKFAAAFRREGRNNVTTPGLGDRPQFMSTPEGMLLGQFKTFMLSDQIRFFARQAQLSGIADNGSEAFRQRIAFGAGISSLVLGSVFVDAMKRAASDNDASWDQFTKRWSDNPGGAMYDSVDRSGVLGALFDVSNTVGKATGGAVSIRSGMGALAGDKVRSDASKLRNVNPLGALAGPAVGLAADVYEIGVALPLRLSAGGSATYADITRAKNLVPFHAVPVFQQGLNWMRDEFAERHGMQSPPPRQ
jgi:hypothetical protein